MTICVLAFDPPPRDLLEPLPHGATLVIADAPPPAGLAWLPLRELLSAISMDEALELLERLNGLRDAAGTHYRSAVRYHEYEPWWFHQQTALDEYLAPYLRYRRVLDACSAAERLILVGCPPELRRILPIACPHARIEDHGRSAPRPRRLRRLASAALHRAATAAATLRCLLRPPDALVYTVDAVDADGRNRWLDGLYRALEARGLRYVDVVWNDSGARTLRHMRLRRRAAVYWQAVAVRARAPAEARGGTANAAGAPAERFLHGLAERVLVPAARASVRSIRRWERLLRVLRPRGAYLMDDPVHALELAVACRRRGIPTVGLQHGQFSRYTAGLMGYGFAATADHAFDRYCVWSGFFKDILAQHSRIVPPASVVVAGSPRRSKLAGDVAARSAPASAPVVLFLGEQYDAHTQRHEVEPYVRALCDAALEVRLKPHPAAAQAPVPHAAGRSGREPTVVAGPLEELIAEADVVVASFSSAIFDAILHARPVVLFATSRYRDPHGLAAAGAAGLAASPAEIVERVVAAAALPAQELERRRGLVWGGAAGDGAATAVREMERLSALPRGARPTRNTPGRGSGDAP